LTERCRKEELERQKQREEDLKKKATTTNVGESVPNSPPQILSEEDASVTNSWDSFNEYNDDEDVNNNADNNDGAVVNIDIVNNNPINNVNVNNNAINGQPIVNLDPDYLAAQGMTPDEIEEALLNEAIRLSLLHGN